MSQHVCDNANLFTLAWVARTVVNQPKRSITKCNKPGCVIL